MSRNEIFHKTEFQYFKNVLDYNVKQSSTITLSDLYESTKSTDNHIYFSINEARWKIEKETDKDKIKGIKTKYKKEIIPCYSPTWVYQNKRIENDIINVNQILYIDIDAQEFKIDELDKDKVLLYYKTMSNKGWAVLVATENLNINNFKEYYTNITRDLGIEKYYDKNVVRYHMAMTMSHDPDIFINSNNLFKFRYESTNNRKPGIITKSAFYDNQNTENYSRLYSGLRYDNIDELKIEGDFINSDKKDINIIKASLPYTVNTGNRELVLSSYCNNLLYLNNTLDYNDLIKILRQINKKVCSEKLTFHELKKIAKSTIEKKENKTLKPIYTPRTIVFKKNAPLSLTDKRSIINKVIGENKSKKTRSEIYDVIEDWDWTLGKITIKKIAKVCKKSPQTVSNYFVEFKSFVRALNKEFLKEKSKEKEK